MNYLNGIMEDIAREIGFEASIRLIGLHGGRQLYIPKDATEDHPLAILLGWKPFCAFVQMYGGETMSVPKVEVLDRMRRVRRVACLLKQGYSRCKLAQQERLCEKQIENIQRQAEELKILPMVLNSKAIDHDSEQMEIDLEVSEEGK